MLVDCFCILAWVAITAAVGVPLYLSGATHPVGVLASNLVAALMTVVPATVVLALLESSARGASIGKRARHLHVVDAATGSRVSLRRSILRNTLKIGVPWTIGHAAVFSISPGERVSVCPCSSLASDHRCLRVPHHVRRLSLCWHRTHSIRPYFGHHRHPGSSSRPGPLSRWTSRHSPAARTCRPGTSAARQVTRPIRNREARVTEPQLA